MSESSTYSKMLPSGLPAWHMPFWQALQKHELRVQKCVNCGALRHIPKELCPSCHRTGFSWEPIGLEGTIFTYSVVHRAPVPAFQQDMPYVIVHVQMDDGVRMIADLVDVNPNEVAIGQRVIAGFDDVTPEWTLLRFRKQ